jgi:hypothetical protein
LATPAIVTDPEPDDPLIKNVRAPTQCVLWEKPGLVVSAKDHFEVVENFVDTSHLVRSLLKCRECGQLYFSEYCEMVDWDDGDDAQYSTYVPVSTEQEIAALKQGSTMEILFYAPRLQWDYPAGAGAATVRWIGKE